MTVRSTTRCEYEKRGAVDLPMQGLAASIWPLDLPMQDFPAVDRRSFTVV